MAELKTTQEDREAIRWAHVATGSEFAPTMRALDDLDTLLAERESLRSTMGGLIACNDTLLAENAKLRAVRLAAREYRAMCAPGLDMCRDLARDDLDAALAALEAP